MGTNIQSQRRLREVSARIGEIGQQAGRLMWELGGLLTEVESSELWRATQYPGFLEWVDDELKFSRQTARKYQRIHEQFSADMAERYGSEKLDAGLAYLAVTKREEAPGDLVGTAVRVRTPQGKFKSVPFPKASVRQIKAATRLVQAASRPKSTVPDPTVTARVVRLNAELGAGGLGVTVVASVGADGRTRLSLTDLVADDLPAVLDLLRQHLLDGKG